MADQGITYEGVSMREHDEQFRRNYYLPGESVRLDEKVRVHGIDRDALAETLGREPLTITKTIATGDEVDNGMGGKTPSILVEYEFEGHEGRHNAKSFQNELGHEHMYGIVMAREDKLWLVPMPEDLAPDPMATGPAREIVGVTGRGTDELVHPEGLSGLTSEASSSPLSGEFHYQPASFGAAEGNVMIYAIPWMGGASPGEEAAAVRAIDAEILRPEMQENSVYFRESRIRMNPMTDPDGPSEPAMARAQAVSEAIYLLQNYRDPTPEMARVAASIAVTDRGADARDVATDLAAESVGIHRRTIKSIAKGPTLPDDTMIHTARAKSGAER